MVNRQLFSFDLNDPFFKHSVGFDRLFNQLDVINNNHHLESTYPPYNIIKTGDETFSIELAVAGFTKEEIDVEVKQNVITVRGEKKETEEKETTTTTDNPPPTLTMRKKNNQKKIIQFIEKHGWNIYQMSSCVRKLDGETMQEVVCSPL